MGSPTTIRIHRVERLNAKAVRVTLDPGENKNLWPNIPGGYLTFCLPCGDPVMHRSYSLVQAPDAPLPQVVVKEVASGRGSAFINRHFKEGLELMAYPPKGRLYPREWDDVPQHLVLFAGGTGITPLYSVLQHVIQVHPENQVTLFYDNRTFQDILLRHELESWGEHPRVTVRHILSDGSLDDDLYNGRITESKTEKLWHSIQTSLPKKAMVCGPKGMRLAVLQGLGNCNVPAEHIRGEDFQHPPHLKEPLTSTCWITAKQNGNVIQFPYEPSEEELVDALMDRGIHIASTCRGGVCGNCRATVTHGKARVEHSYSLTDEECRQGVVLCCQARPDTSELHLEFKEGQ